MRRFASLDVDGGVWGERLGVAGGVWVCYFSKSVYLFSNFAILSVAGSVWGEFLGVAGGVWVLCFSKYFCFF